MKECTPIVLFYYNELFCVVAQKLKRYFKVSLKSVLFLSLFAANVAILENPSSCFTMRYCVKKYLRENYVLSIKIQLIASFF